MKRNAQLFAVMLGLGVAGWAWAAPKETGAVGPAVYNAVRTQKTVGPDIIIKDDPAVRTQKAVGPWVEVDRAVRTEKTVGPDIEIMMAVRTEKTVGPIIRVLPAVRTQKAVGPNVEIWPAVRTQKTVGPVIIIVEDPAVRTQKAVGPAVFNAVRTEKTVAQDAQRAGNRPLLDLNAGF